MFELSPEQRQMVAAVREFADRSIRPIAREYEAQDRYPHQLVREMQELGLFGLTISEAYGGIGLDYVAYAAVFEELSAAWMSVAGILGTHSVMAYVIEQFGTEQQKQRWLPAMASGAMRGGLALTEPEAGSDIKSLRTTARRSGDGYALEGTKRFTTNSLHGTALLVVARTGEERFSAFVVEKGTPGFEVRDTIHKLGYRGLDTCEVRFTDCRVPAENLVGEREGEGLRQVLSGLELGRINVAARAVGVARAAYEDALRYARERRAFGQAIASFQAIQFMLADMATAIEAARLLTWRAAAKKSRGERADLEAGMAKLFASEMCAKVVLDAMRIHGGYGYTTDYNVERYYRDAPLMIVGEGTNEIQRLVIARRLLGE